MTKIDPIDLEKVGRAVERQRVAQGLSKEAAARKAGISSITWKRVEDGLPVQDAKLAKVMQVARLGSDRYDEMGRRRYDGQASEIAAPTTWGDVLRERREQLDLTQSQLAAGAGVAEEIIARTEADELAPEPENMLAICDVLGIADRLTTAINEVVSARGEATISIPSDYVTDLDRDEAAEVVNRGFMEDRLGELDARIARLERITLRAIRTGRPGESDGAAPPVRRAQAAMEVGDTVGRRPSSRRRRPQPPPAPDQTDRDQ